MTTRPQRTRRYQHPFFDSARWNGFAPRAGDMVVCTSYKSGTTWTQMICALLVHQTPSLPKSMSVMSPWLDAHFSDVETIHAELESQRHTRIIKTHTPLDGLPFHDDVHYIFCGREPRDVFMSAQNHIANADREKIDKLLAAQGVEIKRGELPEDLNERFALWMTRGAIPWEHDGIPFWSHFAHAESYWTHRELPNIHFLHYTDLKADLEGEMRRLASALGISVAEEIWPSLVQAATFDDMKKNADMTAPDAHSGIWKSNEQFFNKGTNAQWHGQLNEESLALYESRSRELYDATMLAWLEEGSQVMGRPEDL